MSSPLRVSTFPVGVCTRHVRLSNTHVDALFGKGHTLTALCDLTQPGEFAALETVNVRGPGGTLEAVRVVGPTRRQTQVELPLRDCEAVGVATELKLTRSIEGTSGCTLEGPAGTVVLADGVLNALRHLRLDPDDARRLLLKPDARITVRIEGDRARVLQDVVVSVEDGAMTELVLETEEAAAIELGPQTRASVVVEDVEE